jgi:hypothetical protein
MIYLIPNIPKETPMKYQTLIPNCPKCGTTDIPTTMPLDLDWTSSGMLVTWAEGVCNQCGSILGCETLYTEDGPDNLVMILNDDEALF